MKNLVGLLYFKVEIYGICNVVVVFIKRESEEV